MKKIIKIIAFLVNLTSCFAYDVNIIGHLVDTSSFSRHTSSFIACLYPEITPKLFHTFKYGVNACPGYFLPIAKKGIDLTSHGVLSSFIKHGGTLNGITIFADSVVWSQGWKKYEQLPNKSLLRFAYCVTERTLILKEQRTIINTWVERLNNNFDALIVPDEWLIETFKHVGVTLPIFVLPLVLNLDSLLIKPVKKKVNMPFVFGFSGGCWPHKNHAMLIRAFAEEFGNDPKVKLKLHSRFNYFINDVIQQCNAANVHNIELDQRALERPEYEKFIAELDCYVTVSKGEGFSIIPREALAAGVPCIVSNNTAQTTICDSGCVYVVPSMIKEPSTWVMSKQSVGYDYNCTVEDVRKALRTVYEQYQHYLEKAHKGRAWVTQYSKENLKNRYLSLVMPQAVILSDRNEVTETHLMTNSLKLYKQYQALCHNSKTEFKELMTCSRKK